MRGDRETCIQAGMNYYICKPVSFQELLNKLAKWALHLRQEKFLSVL
jgi:CheY-like chemotaxis protein